MTEQQHSMRECYHPMTEQLLALYDAERRILPWREDPTPYHVWLSEIMLQQTRVDTVIEYYERFLRTLPDAASLAAAPEEVCLKLWEGLGYYRRIRNMHKAAGVIMEEHGGVIPGTAAELGRLPGIGGYTAAAIASIAFGEAIPSVDGNLLRVYTRITGDERPVDKAEAKKAAEDWFRERIPEDRPGDFNQALMDLGATVCLPNGEPLCERCCWREHCTAQREGTWESLPVKTAKKPPTEEERTVLLIRTDDRVFLRKRPEGELLAAMLEFPSFPGTLTEDEALDAAEKLLRASGYVVNIERVEALPKAEHVFSHRIWRMSGYLMRLEETALTINGLEGGAALAGTRVAEEKPEEDFAFPAEIFEVVSKEGRYALPSAFRAYRRELKKQLKSGNRA